MSDNRSATVHSGLGARAVTAARTYRAADPAGFHRRHHNPTEWARWVRRARVARTVAAAMRVPVGWVAVTDDPDRTHHTRTGPVPGDLITITDPATSGLWHLLPDYTHPGDGWLLLNDCPAGCGATVPIARVATLVDLGDYLDPRADIWPANGLNDDPAHTDRCPVGRAECPS